MAIQIDLYLTHWGRVTHICVGKLTIIGSDNGLSPERRQAIIWTSAGILLIGPLGTNFSEILIEIQTFSLKKIRLKMLSAKSSSFRLGLNVLRYYPGTLLCGQVSASPLKRFHLRMPHLQMSCSNMGYIQGSRASIHWKDAVLWI